MKKIFVLLLSAVLAFTCFSQFACFHKEEKEQPVVPVEEDCDDVVTLSYNESVKKEISPYIYGQFIEHIDTCIYDGIWAELILDRKFHYEVGKSGLSPWKSSGNVSSQTAYTMNGDFAPEISAGGNIYQEGIYLKEKSYDCYFNVYVLEKTTITVSLSYGDYSETMTATFPAGSKFSKKACRFNYKGEDTNEGIFTISVSSGRAIFDAISLMPSDNIKGMRADTLLLLKDMDSPIYRWPGGNFLSGYFWKDGIGNRDKRPSKRNLHYLGQESEFSSEDEMNISDMIKMKTLGFYGAIEPNDFGTDEFLSMCEYLGCEPMMMVNDGLGNISDAADLVEYCNGSESSEWGKKRVNNGHSESYNIKYWGIGNEMFGDWQLGHVSISEYVKRHNNFAAAMKVKYPSMTIIASGDNSNSEWDSSLFDKCSDNFSIISEHMYGERNELDLVKHINNLKNNIQARISKHRLLTIRYEKCSDVKMAITEYSYANATKPSTLKDGMGIGAALNTFIENSEAVEIACYSSTVNATQGCITTTPNKVEMQAAGYVLKMYRKYMQKYFVKSTIDNLSYNLDCSVSVSEDGKTIGLAVINPSDFSIEIDCSCFGEIESIKKCSLTADFLGSYGDELKYEEKSVLNAVAPYCSVSLFVINID